MSNKESRMKRSSSCRVREISRLAFGHLLALFVAASFVHLAGAQDDPFAQVPAPGSAPGKNPTMERIDFEVSVKPQEAKRGETVKLTITGLPLPGFHTYPMTQRTDNPLQDEIALSKLTFEKTAGLQPLWPVEESPPSLVEEQGIGYFWEHNKPFTWSQDILILPEAKPGPLELRFRVNLQVCDK